MIVINRIPVDPTRFDKSAKGCQERVEDSLGMISSGELPFYLESIADDASKLANIQAYSIESGLPISVQLHRSLREHLTIALQTYVSIFRLAMSKGKKTRIEIGGVSMEAKVDLDDLGNAIDEGYWKGGFELAHILRDKEALELFLSVPDKFFRNSSLGGDVYRLLFVDFLKSLYLDPDSSKAKLMKAYKAAAPENIKVEDPEYVLNYPTREMEVYMAFLMEDQQQITEYLAKLVQSYKDMLIKDELTNSPAWFISKSIVAIASFLHHNGYAIEVDSEYMPRYMIEGNF